MLLMTQMQQLPVAPCMQVMLLLLCRLLQPVTRA